MAISFNNALGIHEQALYLRSHRAEVLANNLANVDTPNFKARDVDFSSLLDNAKGQSSGAMTAAGKPQRTNERHLSLNSDDGDGDLLYKVPSQPSIDGNTVEEHQEMAQFAKNAMNYEASLSFLNTRFKGLQMAIQGQ
ncbi:MAG TPA: flagellar basal body rod protein FlgB [Spongiibacteraceae bacterium]|nr:flagellar basal body rod protein FlgB [Spongiibacteraceae bacterium]